MSSNLTCRSTQRRQRLIDGVEIPGSGGQLLNGIDYLEVMDTAFLATGLPPDLATERQQILVIRCLQPVVGAVTASRVQIAGGERVTDIDVVWAQRLADARTTPDPASSPAEQAWVSTGFLPTASADEVSRWIVVKVSERGDASTYTLSLTETDGVTVLSGFDRVLYQVDFNFKVECPSDFDCATTSADEDETASAPRIDYLARDFQSFRKLMLDRMSVVAPDWEERNPVDLGVALVEILAYAADQLAYYQDAVATEAYLETARKRVSVRRHARLLDYPMHDGCNARAWVQLQLVDGQELVGSAGAPTVPQGTPFLTWVADGAVISTTGYDKALLKSPLVFEAMHDKETLTWAQNEITLHTFGEDDCCLPAGATGATLVLPGGTDLRLSVGDVLIFEEIRSPESGARADADPSHRHAVRLSSVGDSAYEDYVVESGLMVLDVGWEIADALPFELCLLTVQDELGVRGPVTVARGNMVLADHGRSVNHDEDDPSAQPDEGEPLVPPTVPDSGKYRTRLKGKNLSFAASYDDSVAASASLEQDPREAVPVVTLHDDARGTIWSPQRDLLGSDETAAEFVVEMENDGRAWLRFGDDEHGRAPTAGTELRAFYRVGNGSEGNVGAEALAHVVSDTLTGAVTLVRNPMAASGGQDPESIDEVKLYAPQAFRTQKRAVTAEDWETVCGKHPEVQRAVATFRWTGSWYTVFITVDRQGGLDIDADFEEELREYLEPYRLAGYDLEIEPPRPVSLDLALSVCVAPSYYKATVKAALLLAFSNRVNPDGSKGFFHPDNLSFGEPVYLSAIIARAMQVPGVAWVDATPNSDETGMTFEHRFQRLHEPATDGLRQGYVSIGRLEIARLDNDPSLRENGLLSFNMRGGL